MKEQEEIQDNSRRVFLKNVAIATVATAACGSLACSCSSNKVAANQKVRLLSPDGEIVEIDSAYLNYNEHMAIVSKLEARQGIAGKKFVMVVDLSRCKNARKCVSACQKWHYRPEQTEWLSVKLMKDSDKGAPYWFPKQCFHCDNPPCVKVCPVDATFKRKDGVVLIDSDRCIGCRFCMAACPYSARVFNWGEDWGKGEDSTISPNACTTSCNNSIETSLQNKMGTVSKCDFCVDMVRLNKLPDCVTNCPNGTLFFGDANEDVVTNGEDTFRLSELIRDRAGYRYLEELGTEPRVYYLPPVERNFPFEEDSVKHNTTE